MTTGRVASGGGGGRRFPSSVGGTVRGGSTNVNDGFYTGGDGGDNDENGSNAPGSIDDGGGIVTS